jgi:hypothetical protein
MQDTMQSVPFAVADGERNRFKFKVRSHAERQPIRYRVCPRPTVLKFEPKALRDSPQQPVHEPANLTPV